MNKFRNMYLLLMSIVFLYGCASTKVNTAIENVIEPIDGKVAVITTSHNALSKFSMKLSKAISDSLTKNNIESVAIEFDELSLDENSVIKQAINTNSQNILAIALTKANTHAEAFTSIEGNVQLVNIKEKKLIWNSAFKFRISLSGPWSYGAALESISKEITNSLLNKKVPNKR